MTTSARDALREATGAVHERLHGVECFARLASGRITREEYRALLARLQGFHAALEAALAAAPSLSPSLAIWGIDLAERRRSPLLVADRAALGDEAAVPAAPIPVPGSAATAMGWLYVSEGSTLGGLHLARALDPLLGEAREGRLFLLGHGARHGAMWRECCAAIEACGADPARRQAMTEGAVAGFHGFESWFGEVD
ncbi:biliverdin-producing heme oxygenase [Roseomonas stagni]|uniref:Biliverdin-producing heme oxygenase n=1 Tax=Falsiroseomonas algicola TaxID=2716930 RepID=A0A6M1LQY6_9PROT|nr:biliverdin-producing heme oxygenase [Falsiroseomonas algicola]NGM22379.1 biliverdin-producing heme oxygenase [Falsiroseomonas algicola]